MSRTHSKASVRVSSAAEQTEAAVILELLISLALQTTPVDVEALSYIKLMCTFFEVTGFFLSKSSRSTYLNKRPVIQFSIQLSASGVPLPSIWFFCLQCCINRQNTFDASLSRQQFLVCCTSLPAQFQAITFTVYREWHLVVSCLMAVC